MVLPYMEDVHSRQRTIDELPQSAQGKTIMTTEPKFIPKDAAEISLEDDTRIKIRLIDCVGFMVDGAAGHMEGSTDRMVIRRGSTMRFRLWRRRPSVRKKS